MIPSSFQIFAADFGPSPGRCMKRATSGGTCALRFVERVDLAVVDDLDDLLLDRLADPGELLARPSSASWATEHGVSRIRVAARR